MKRIMTCIAVLLSGTAIACSSSRKAAVAGGFTEQRDPTRTEISLFTKMAPQLEKPLEPLSVATQVVAGTNYRFVCKPFEGKKKERWEVVIYRNLNGELSILRVNELSSKQSRAQVR